jgi:hypothetical protein
LADAILVEKPPTGRTNADAVVPVPGARRSGAERLNTWFIGVDEAGYGPNLGPLVVASTAFRASEALIGVDWWRALARVVSRSGGGGALVIDDSKSVHQGPQGAQRLERAVRSVLSMANISDAGAWKDERLLDASSVASLRAEHWFDGESADEPIRCGGEEASNSSTETLRCTFRAAGVEWGRPLARAVFPREFNQLLDRTSSKAEAESVVVAELVRAQLGRAAADCERIFVAVDRLGGRRFYRPLVESIAPDSCILTREEGPQRSRYCFRADGRDVEIEFSVRADRTHLPTAAASMTAKWIRERCMAGFNAFWTRAAPGLRPTAGYPVDARRFRAEVEPHLNRLGVPLDCFWRRK